MKINRIEYRGLCAIRSSRPNDSPHHVESVLHQSSLLGDIDVVCWILEDLFLAMSVALEREREREREQGSTSKLNVS